MVELINNNDKRDKQRINPLSVTMRAQDDSETASTIGLVVTLPAAPEGSSISADISELMVVIDGKRQQYRFENNEDSKLGDGNQAVVYACQGLSDNKEYVIKLYRLEMINEEKLQEILSFLEKNHFSHVTHLVEYGTCMISDNNYYYAVMEYYEKIDKGVYLRWNNSDNEVYRNRIVGFVEQMNRAMEYMHSNKIYHGDIKPDNIMLDKKTKDVVLVDFGGATMVKENGRSALAVATTARYISPETKSRGKINAYSDYYLLGVSLAEYINGVYPGDRECITNRFDNIRGLYYFFVPENLPKHYLNLLRGLLYESSNDDEIKSYRWGTKKVYEWLEYMKRGNFEQAAKCNSISEERVVSGNNESKWTFGNQLSLELGDEEYVFENLSELADTFAEHWDEGMDVMLNELEAFGSIRADLRSSIKKASDRMQNVATGTGHSLNAEYFKFLYKYVSDKRKFYWKNLPGVHTKEEFAERLLLMLEKKKAEDYDFGEWWMNMSDRTISNSTVFAEIFGNKVFSYYLDKAGETDNVLLAQCAKAEQVFRETKEKYTYEEMSELYALAYRILGITDYELPSGQVFETYGEFLAEVKNMAYDPERVYEAMQVKEAIKHNDEYIPGFLAWKKLQGETV